MELEEKKPENLFVIENKQEEQKPKKFLETEIKQEADYVLEEIKKEPLNEEYFEQKKNVPKLEDSIDTFLSTTSDVSTQLPCPKDHIQLYVSQNYSNRSTHPYHSTHKNKKISNSGSKPRRKKLVTSDDKRIKAAEIKTGKPVNSIVRYFKNVANRRRVCSVCSRLENERIMKGVSLEDDKLVFMVSCILRGEYSLGEAEFNFSKKKTISICHSHFFEARDEIYKRLHCESLKDVLLCSDELMNNLMIIVNRLRPCTICSFRNILKQFFWKNERIVDTFVPSQIDHKDQISECALEEGIQLEAKHLPEDVQVSTAANYLRNENETSKINHKISGSDLQPDHFAPNVDQKKKIMSRRCAICSRPSNYFKCMTVEYEKAIIMVGCILGGKYNIINPQSKISIQRNIVICREHFSEAINEIFKVLKIATRGEIFTCSVDSIEEVMVTVNDVCPQFMVSNFCRVLYDFEKKNQNL